MMNDSIYVQLHNAFKRLISEYASVYNTVMENNDWKNSFRDIISKDIPDLLRNSLGINAPYTVVGSYGKGRWAAVPWIAIFDSRITTSAQKGVYIAYLLNKDTQELYLSFEIAVTEVIGTKTNPDGNVIFAGVAGKINPETKTALQKRANQIRTVIKDTYFSRDEMVNTGVAGYDLGTVYYKRYTIDDLPDGKTLISDLDRMMEIYKRYYDRKDKIKEMQSACQIGTFDSWEILSESTAVKTCDKSFFDYHGSGVPKGICWFFDAENLPLGESKKITLNYNGNSYIGSVTNESSDRRRVRIFWGKDLASQFATFSDNEGVKAIFTKISADVYQVEMNRNAEEGEDKVPVSTKEAMKQVKDYIEARGFTYKDGLIENFFLSLKSKPFVILAGTSGTGKTRLVKLFAEAIGAEYQLVSVRPDWSDGSDLFGHYDLNGKFIDGPVCQCFKMAYEKPNRPVFLCLDEMNLARVEYYLSDFLSVIESREKTADGNVVTTPIMQYEKGIPDNLHIVGTVNMDETTFPFSKKVLDRANTIEFSYVDLTPTFDAIETVPEKLQLPNSFLRTEYLVLSRDCSAEQEYVREICAELQAINEILAKANAHVGYRVRDEIVFYMLNNKAEGGLLTHDEAFDNEIMQKILPRIQGSSASVRDMLCELFRICASDPNQKTGDTDSEKMRKVLSDESIQCRYRKSAEKLELMVRRFEEDGFTSYWL